MGALMVRTPDRKLLVGGGAPVEHGVDVLNLVVGIELAGDRLHPLQ